MRKILLIIHLLLNFPCYSFAETVTLKTFIAAPAWNYSQIRLGQKSTLPASCTIGTFTFYNGSIVYCENNAGTGRWSNASSGSVWSKSGNDIYATDYSNANLKVGIGTSTPSMKLTVAGGILASGGDEVLSVSGAGTKFIWYPLQSAFRAGKVSIDEWDDVNIGQYSAVIGGTDSSVVSSHSTVGAGHDNHITSIGSNNVVAGGEGNIINGGSYSAIAVGTSNTTSSLYTFMGASSQSTIGTNNDRSAILSGLTNQITGLSTNSHAIIIGGNNNTINGANNGVVASGNNNTIETGALNSFIATGGDNQITLPNSAIATGGSNSVHALLPGNSSFIGSGESTEVSGIASVVGIGGLRTKIYGNNSFIGTGHDNIIEKAAGTVLNSAIFSGHFNIITVDNSFIGSGYLHTISGARSAISGGSEHTIGGGSDPGISNFSGGGYRIEFYSDYSGSTGGAKNVLDANYVFVSGGFNNFVNAEASSVVSGNGNYISITSASSFIGGGLSNTINGTYSVILGGTNNTVDSDYSFAGGNGMTLDAAADNTFVYGWNYPTPISAPNAFILMNVRVALNHTNSSLLIPLTNLITLVGGAYSDGTTWTNASSIEFKESIKDLQNLESLKTLNKLKPVKFNYKSDDEPYIGFIAEDVPKLVAVNGRKSLNSMDFIALLTKVVQQQQKMIKEQEQELRILEERIQGF